MNEIANLLSRLNDRGVTFWVENGQLRYRAPRNALAREEITILGACKEHIVMFLQKNAKAGAQPHVPDGSAPRFKTAPLTYSQLQHWNRYRLSERPSLRQIAAAIRIQGSLHIPQLKVAVATLVRRHEALRTRIVVHQDIPWQQISETVSCEIAVDDLTELSEGTQEAQVLQAIEQDILEPIQVGSDLLFSLRLVKLGYAEHVLIVAMEHMICDPCSMGIFLMELFSLYSGEITGEPRALPRMQTQFSEYAVWQRNASKSWTERHGAAWDELRTQCRLVRFPDNGLHNIRSAGWGTVPIKIEKKMKEALRAWSRSMRTTLPLSIFSAYVASVLQWCRVSDLLVQYVFDGRTHAGIERSIGYFASVLYLHINLLDRDRLVDLMSKVTQEYCRAYERADFSYLEAQVPPPEFVRNTTFNWVPQGSTIDTSELDGTPNALNCTPIQFLHPMIKSLEHDAEPAIVLYDTDDDIIGGIHYPLGRFSSGSMQRFTHNFVAFINSMVNGQDRRVKDLFIPDAGPVPG